MSVDNVIFWGFVLGVISSISVLICAASVQYAHHRINELEKKLSETIKVFIK